MKRLLEDDFEKVYLVLPIQFDLHSLLELLLVFYEIRTLQNTEITCETGRAGVWPHWPASVGIVIHERPCCCLCPMLGVAPLKVTSLQCFHKHQVDS